MTDDRNAFSRRGFVQSTAALSLLGTVVGGPAFRSAAAAGAPPAASGAVALDFVRLRGRADGKAMYWVMRGVRYLWSGSDVIPLHHVSMLTAVRFESRADGEFLTTILENSVSTDLRSHEPIVKFTNPLTGREESIWSGPPQPAVIHTLGADGRLIPPAPRGSNGTRVHGQVRYHAGFSSELSMEDRFNARFPGEDGRHDYATESSIYRALNPTLIEGGACYDRVTKTSVISRNWSFGGAGRMASPQLLGLYEGRRYLSSDEAFAEPGVPLVETVGPGTLEAIANF